MAQFVINKTSGNFSTSLGRFQLKPGEARPITDNELQDDEISYGIRIGLLELSDSPNVIVENPPLAEFNLDTSLVPKVPEQNLSAEDIIKASADWTPTPVEVTAPAVEVVPEKFDEPASGEVVAEEKPAEAPAKATKGKK